MKRTIAMILCVIMFVAALGAAGMAVTVSANESQNISSAIRGGSIGGTKKSDNAKTTGGFTIPGRTTNKKSSSSAKGPWLPDPCNVLGVSGKYVKTQKVSGTTVKYYSYKLDASIEEISDMVTTYTWALSRELDYEICQLRITGDEIDAVGLRKNGEMAELYLMITDDSNYTSKYSVITWEVLLAVPETMEFQLGRKTPGIINGENKCPSCEGSKKCEFCHGYGKQNYGSGYETCKMCGGNKACTICGGSGVSG